MTDPVRIIICPDCGSVPGVDETPHEPDCPRWNSRGERIPDGLMEMRLGAAPVEEAEHEHHWAFFNDQMRECRPGCGAVEWWREPPDLYSPEMRARMKEIARGMERQVTCDCASRSPSYPTYRDSPHLPDCIWWRIEQIEARLAAVERTADEVTDA